MRPVVNGLAESYGNEVEFWGFNIASEEGQAWARHYNLLGHPAYLLLDARGEERWRAVGVIPSEMIEVELKTVLP